MIRLGISPFPPLSPERIEAARQLYGSTIDDYLRHLRTGDPLADDLVLAFERLPRGRGYKLLQQALDHGIDSLDDPPPELVALFRQVDHVPFWVDWDRMKYGNAKVLRNAFLTALSFALYALPISYMRTQYIPLAFTKELLDNAPARYSYTAAFVVDSFLPNGLQRFSEGFKTCIRVRIGHAMVRRKILRSGDWDTERFGVPVNQSHMAIAAILFSFFVIEGLEKMGTHFNPADRESVLLIWRYVGWLLGIDHELVNTSQEEARRMLEIAFSVEGDPDSVTVALCQSTIDGLAQYIQVGPRWMQSRLPSFFYALSRLLLGKDLADRLEYPKSSVRLKVACRVFITYLWITQRVPGITPRFVQDPLGVSFWLDNVAYR